MNSVGSVESDSMAEMFNRAAVENVAIVVHRTPVVWVQRRKLGIPE